MQSLHVRAFVLSDYDAVFRLWQSCNGIGLNDSDTQSAIGDFLARNPGLSRVAEQAGAIVGAVLCGHDGRRGYLHHLAVAPSHRGCGLGRTLVGTCLEGLRATGIPKCNIFLFNTNAEGRAFWTQLGWNERTDLAVLQKNTDAPI